MVADLRSDSTVQSVHSHSVNHPVGQRREYPRPDHRPTCRSATATVDWVLRPAYRARQFVAALAARVTDADVAEAEAHLPPGARPLFRRMPRDAQAHGLRVLRDLKRAGETHP